MPLVCHYGEIALKRGNRDFFEKKLIENIKLSLQKTDFEMEKIQRLPGRLIVRIKNEKNLTPPETQKIKETLANVFGLVNFSFAEECSQNIKTIKKTALEILKRKLKTENWPVSFQSRGLKFKVETKRSEKNFPLNSQEINEQVGDYLLKNFKVSYRQRNKKIGQMPIKVNLENPQLTVFIEIAGGKTFLYSEKLPGPGGLPVGVSGRAVSLISGGIDSPVASYLAMKRGLELVFAHFHSFPYTNQASIKKVEKLVETLKKFQTKAHLYLIPFANIQKEIFLKTLPSFRIILYRRMMLRLAEQIAQKENCQALLTGDNLGQVSSQTLNNLAVIEKAITLPLLRPLLCYDKEEIIEKAKEIKTYDISILPHDDCCTRFLPTHPSTKADPVKIAKMEEKLEINSLTKEALLKTEIIKIK